VRVLCLVELDANGAADSSLRAVAFARGLAGADGQVAAVMFGDADRVPGAALSVAGADAAYVVEPAALPGYAPVAWARALAGLAGLSAAAGQATPAGQAGAAGQAGPGGWAGAEPGAANAAGEAGADCRDAPEQAGAVVAAGTDRGNEVLAHLGALTGLPMAANCVAARHVAPGEYRLARQRWAGLLLEDARLTAPAALLTVATDAIDPASADLAAADLAAADPAAAGPASAGAAPADGLPVQSYQPELAESDLAVRAVESAAQAGGASLATARVVVGGGRGVGGPEGFAPLEELAGLLGGVVGVSRVVTSEGWRPHRQQVGQTGTRITPEVYLACGISGAIQHMAGCAGAKHIIAVNTDPGAPIVRHADYAVLGDLKEVIPALIAAIRARTPHAGPQP